MNKTSLIAIAAILFLSPVRSHAAPAEVGTPKVANEIAALVAARRMSLVHAPGDLLQMATSKTLEAEIAEQIKTIDVAGSAAAVISMPSSTTVEFAFPGRTVDVGYDEFDKNVLLISGQRLKLESYKTIINYKNEIELILSRRSARSTLVIPRAEAATVGTSVRWMSLYLSAIAWDELWAGRRGTGNMPVPGKGDLEDQLILAYQQDIDHFSHIMAMDGHHSRMYTELNEFTCKFPNLQSIDSVSFFAGGEEPAKVANIKSSRQSKVLNELTSKQVLVKTENGYRYAGESGSAELTPEFMVASVEGQGGDLPKVHSNFLQSSALLQFPKIAASCCAKPGCDEKVHQAKARYLKHTAGAYQRLRSSAD